MNEIENAAENVEQLLTEIKKEICDEIENQIGPVTKIELFKDNPRGIVKLRFESAIHAEKCIKLMNERWFDER